MCRCCHRRRRRSLRRDRGLYSCVLFVRLLVGLAVVVVTITGVVGRFGLFESAAHKVAFRGVTCQTVLCGGALHTSRCTNKASRPTTSNSTHSDVPKQTMPPQAENHTKRPAQHAHTKLTPTIHHETTISKSGTETTTESALPNMTVTRTFLISGSQGTFFSSAAHSNTLPTC